MQLLGITFGASEQLCELFSRAKGRCLLSMPEACRELAISEGMSVGSSVEMLPPVSAEGGVKALVRLNLHGLYAAGFPQKLALVYPGLRQTSSFEVETLPALEVVDAADLGPNAAVLIDCPGLTSSLVVSLITASPRRFERIYFVLPDVPILDSESSSGDVCSLLEASGYVLMLRPIKVGSRGNLYEAHYDSKAARVDELQVKTDQLRVELAAARKEIEASEAERKSLLQHLQDADERLQGALEAKQKALNANQLAQQVAVKSQSDTAELRSRYEERVLEVEQLNGLIEQLQSRLEVAAGLYERLLEASPEALGRLGLDP